MCFFRVSKLESFLGSGASEASSKLRHKFAVRLIVGVRLEYLVPEGCIQTAIALEGERRQPPGQHGETQRVLVSSRNAVGSGYSRGQTANLPRLCFAELPMSSHQFF